MSCAWHSPRLRHGAFAIRTISFTWVPQACCPLPLSCSHLTLLPHFLPSRLFFFSVVRPFEGEPLHSSKAVGRARDSTSNLEQGRPNAVDNVNWWAGNWESVVRTMPGRETTGKKQWAPISIYLDLWGHYRCCFFYFIFLLPFPPPLVFVFVFSFFYCRNYVVRNICPNVSLLIICFVLSQTARRRRRSFSNCFAKRVKFILTLYFKYIKYYIT